MDQRPASILFVCTGNTCRSPMAAALCNDLIARYYPDYAGKIQISSAGCAAFDGDQASTEAVEVMAGYNISLDHHQACRVNEQLVADADLIITMGEGHRLYLLRNWPEVEGRTYTLRELADEYGDVSDPIGQGVEVYQETAAELERLLLLMLKRMLGEPSGQAPEPE